MVMIYLLNGHYHQVTIQMQIMAHVQSIELMLIKDIHLIIADG